MQSTTSLLGQSAEAFPPPEPILYRPNVAAILRNTKGEILVAERSSVSGAWQFPQGGVDESESLAEALVRELEEEVGVTEKLITIKEQRGGYRYEFPKGRLKFGLFGGQEQTYFLCDFHGTDRDIQLDLHNREFDHHMWIAPAKFQLSWVPKFKRATYVAVFKDFFDIELH